MINIQIKRSFNLNNIKLNFSKQLNKGIKIIADDIELGIHKGSQFGKPFKPNAKSTADRKGFNSPLIDEGYLSDSNKMVKTKATREHQVAVLSPGDKMRGNGKHKISNIDIAKYNNKGTSTIPARQFWGISEKANRHIMKSIEYEIIKELKRA